MAQKAAPSQVKGVTRVPPTPAASVRRSAGRTRRVPPVPQKPTAFSVELVSADMIDDEFRAEWRGLQSNAERPNPYFENWFLEPALEHLDLKREVRLCVIRQKGGKLAGLLPVVFQSGYCKLPLKHIAVWQHQHCYDGTPLIARGLVKEVHTAILDLIDARPAGTRFFRYQRLPYDAETEEALTQVCVAKNRTPRIQDRYQRAILSGGADFETTMQSALSGKKRKELRRQMNRFADLGAAAFTELPVDNASIDAFIALENAGWKRSDPEGFPFAQCIHAMAFFREAMLAGARKNAVQCLALTLNGDPAAMLLSLKSKDHLSAFKTSYNEQYSAYSPGFRLIMEATRRTLEEDKARICDSCARPGHPVVERLWPDRLPIVQLNIASSRWTDKSLLALAATLEKLKLSILKRFGKNQKDGVHDVQCA